MIIVLDEKKEKEERKGWVARKPGYKRSDKPGCGATHSHARLLPGENLPTAALSPGATSSPGIPTPGFTGLVTGAYKCAIAAPIHYQNIISINVNTNVYHHLFLISSLH